MFEFEFFIDFNIYLIFKRILVLIFELNFKLKISFVYKSLKLISKLIFEIM